MIETERSEKLSFATKLAYGSGDLGTAITAALRGFFLLFFFTDVARLSPTAAASILLIIRIWDAVNDPLIGWLSDRTQTRWGRRRPWLLFGAIPFGIFYFLLWLTPDFSTTGKFIYYTVISLLLDTVYTMINVPYTALTPELTRDYDERTSLNSFRFAFSVGGTLISAVLHPIIVGSFDNVRTGYMISGLIWALVSTIPCFIVFAFTRERPESIATAGEPTMPFFEQIRIAFSNRAYRFVIGIYLCAWLALQIVSTVLIYYMTYYFNQANRLPLVLLAIQGTTLIFLFVWSQVCRHLDKRIVYILGASLWLIIQLVIAYLKPTQSGWVIPLAVVAGAGVAVAYLIPWAMMPDVIEVDELETGQRREGIFYGFMVFLQKLGIALGVFMVGRLLDVAGYITPTDAVPTPVQPESVLNVIRLFMGPVPSFILLISLILAWFYPLTRSKHNAIRQQLAARRSTSHATLPADS